MKQIIILLGGTPTVGKSTMAKMLSKHLGLPWIPTDITRDIMKAISNPKDRPDLYNAEGLSAEEFLTKFSPEQIAEMEYDQGLEAWPGNKVLIEENYTMKEGFIVEGVNILPELIPSLDKSKDIRPVFLIDEDDERVRNVIFTRGLYTKASDYSDDVKEKEVEWTRILSNRIEKSAHKLGYPVINVEKNTDEDLIAVLNALNLE